MNVIFHIEYFAGDDEQMYIVIDNVGEFAMARGAYGDWSLLLDVEAGTTYHYELRGTDGSLRRSEELGLHKVVGADKTTIFDCWHDVPADKPFYSTLFTDGVFRRVKRAKAKSAKSGVILQVEAPTITTDELLGVLGSHKTLGEWNAKDVVIMNDAEAPVWSAYLPASVAGSEYKFVILDAATLSLKRFEDGANRYIPHSGNKLTVIRDLRLRDSRRRWKGAGVAIPVFSLRSEEDWGCGEFTDLKKMADWASATGMSVIQLLPVNDTNSTGTWKDSYPYNAVSSFALHLLYINPAAVVEACAKVADAATKRQLRSTLKRYAVLGAELNEMEVVDYEAVMRLKTEFLHEVYALCGAAVLATENYTDFYKESEDWLLPYMVFCVLRDKYGTCRFSQWKELKAYDKKKVAAYAKKNADKVGFYGFVQYLLDMQLVEVRNYLHSKGVALKGDIPIGVSPISVDVWCAPELYNTTMSAGAPPDAFAEDGQNWGFPTYNWDKMAEDGYAWWCSRLGKMARYFDAYRIDHILGFFRIWEVPLDAVSAILGHFNPSKPYSAEEIYSFNPGWGFNIEEHVSRDMSSANALFLEYPYEPGRYFPRIEGYKTEHFQWLSDQAKDAFMRIHDDFYYRRHNDFWRDCAMKRLPALMASSSMLTCGEDLGMIPACVPDVMSSQRILSLEIQRMPKDTGVDFAYTWEYPYLSVAATSTHDMATIRGWWREDAELRQRYWNNILGFGGGAEWEMSGYTARRILELHMTSGSMLAILPLQDWLAIDEKLRRNDPDAERINVPANPNHYWRYRMHLTLEALCDAEEFNQNVRSLVDLR